VVAPFAFVGVYSRFKSLEKFALKRDGGVLFSPDLAKLFIMNCVNRPPGLDETAKTIHLRNRLTKAPVSVALGLCLSAVALAMADGQKK